MESGQLDQPELAWGRKSRSLGVFSFSVSVPQCGGCVTVWEGVLLCERVCLSEGGCVLL